MSNKRIKKKQAKEQLGCALCGKPLLGTPRVIGKTGRGVCEACLSVSQSLLGREDVSRFTHNRDVVPPSVIIRELNKAIIGQENAKRAVAVALWKQQLRARGANLPNSGLLLYGPTGCGKTALTREAAKISGLPYISFDATSLSETGYRGHDAEEMVHLLVEHSGKKEAEHGIIFLDEVDKLAAQGGDKRIAYSRGTQHSLLKLIEGYEVDGVDTSGILFLFGGAFTGLTAKVPDQKTPIGFDRTATEKSAQPKEIQVTDFIAYGMEPELMGRIGRCVPLNSLSEDDLRRILTESRLSSYLRYQEFFCSRGKRLILDRETEQRIIRMALCRGTGARGLNTLVEEWMEEKLMDLAEEGSCYEC